MDPPGSGRYGLQQGWDNNSALEGYAAFHDPNFRAGGSYDERRYKDEKYPRGHYYQRDTFHRDIMDRDGHQSAGTPAVGHWSQSKRRDYTLSRECRHPERPCHESYYCSDVHKDRERDRYSEFGEFQDGYGLPENHEDRGYVQSSHLGGHECDDYAYDDYEYRSRSSRHRRDDSLDSDYDHHRPSYDSDRERGSRRDGNWRQRDSRDRERDTRCSSREIDSSVHRRHEKSRSRSHSHGYDDRPRSRSPQARSCREDSNSDSRPWRSEKRKDREEKRQRDHYSVAPSATVVVKGLPQKTTEEDLYQILAEWGPLRHVRVIRERSSGISRGFAFIDFPSLEAAFAMMGKLGDDGLVVDGRKLFFEYSSKPTGGPGGPFAQESSAKSGYNHKMITMPSDWRCTICDYINFARRTSCYQCNEPRMDDAPPADISMSYSASLGKKGSEAGPTHVLVVRGLDDNADEEMLRYEFSKHVPIKDLRLVRDKFTHVSRGFAFVHFYSVEDATTALEATNGTTLEKNGQILRVAYAKSTLGPGGTSASQSNSLAAAAIEAAAFSQQYDALGWAPKEYNPDEKAQVVGQPQNNTGDASQKDGMAPQSGFVWDEASGYYYDAASGFYYDGNTGLYYDGNNGTWYSYDCQTQQYIPYTDQNSDKTPRNQSELSKASDNSNGKNAIISAPATTIAGEKSATLPDAVRAAAAAAIAAEKKEKEKLREIKLASRSSILASKKKMNNVLTMWKQRSHEGQATRVALDDNEPSISADASPFSIGNSAKTKCRSEVMTVKENNAPDSGFTLTVSPARKTLESEVKRQAVSNSIGGTLMGVIRGSVRGAMKAEASYSGSTNNATYTSDSSLRNSAAPTTSTPFRKDVSALGSYTPSMSNGSGKRRFSETPVCLASTTREQPQTFYRDRAAERRSLYGSSSSSVGNDSPDIEFQDSNRDRAIRKGSGEMPFPPGVGGGPVFGADTDNYEVITADKAIDESNVGNRMLRSMGWQEGLGLGKDGSGLTEPVQAQGMESRAGLGSQKKKLDPTLEVQHGDSYKTLIQKKALARFREMS